MWCGLGVEKVEPSVSKYKNWMREKFILNIYKNDEWAPLWAAEDKAQRVHAMMVYWYKLQWHLNVTCRGVKIRDFWLKQGKLKNSHKGGVVRVLCENFAQGTIHPPKCKIGFFQTAITSSFQIQIAHRLNLWTLDFPRFETRYSTHEMNFGKWLKCSQQLPKWGGTNCSVLAFLLCFPLFSP